MIDFSTQLKSLDGQDIGEMSELVANTLMQQPAEENAVKLYDLAMKIYKDKKVDLDDTDAATVKKAIEDAKGMTVFAKGQILKLF